MNHDTPPLRSPRPWRTFLLLLVLPIAFVAGSLLPGLRFLPLAPVAFAPLSMEDPGGAKDALERANDLAADRVFPLLTDQLAIRRAVLAGSMPSWEPRLGLGMPLAAATLCGVWYPPNVLAILLPPDRAAGWLALLALFLAGLGMYAFLGARGLGDAARLVGAWSFQAGGFALVNLHCGMKVDAALWLPFALISIEGMLAARGTTGDRARSPTAQTRVLPKRFARVGLAASIALSFLAGFPPIAVFVASTALVYGLVRAIQTEQRAAIARRMLEITLCIALGVAAAAIQWIPMREASLQSLRVEETSASIAAQSLPLATSASLLVPDLFGRPGDGVFAPHEAVAWWLTRKDEAFAAQTADALDWSLFAGFTVLVLAIAAIVARPRDAALPCALLLLVLGFVQGWPGVRWLYALPGFDLGSPARASAIAWMLWPWLAALGVEALVSNTKRAAATVRIVAICALVLGAVMASSPAELFAQSLQRTLAERHGVAADVVESVVPLENARLAGLRLVESGEMLALVALAILILTALPMIAARIRARARPSVAAHDSDAGEPVAPPARATFAAVAPWLLLIALEGGYVAREHLAPRTVGDRGVFPESAAMEAIREAAGDGRVVRLDPDPAGIADVARLARPNLLSAYGIADLMPCSVFTPKSLVELVSAVDPTAVYRTGISRISDVTKIHHRLFDLLRVTCILSRAPIADPKLELHFATRDFYVYRRKGALPIARVVPAEPILASGAINVIEYWSAGIEDPRHAAIAISEDLPPQSERPRTAAGPFSPGTVEVSRPAADRLDARVTQSSGGWIVFQEQWYPGWKATVNGIDAPVVRVDHVCRAVPIPAGDCVVRTKYEPDSTRLATWITLLAILITFLWTWRAERGSAGGAARAN